MVVITMLVLTPCSFSTICKPKIMVITVDYKQVLSMSNSILKLSKLKFLAVAYVTTLVLLMLSAIENLRKVYLELNENMYPHTKWTCVQICNKLATNFT